MFFPRREFRFLTLVLVGLVLAWLSLVSPAPVVSAATSNFFPLHAIRSADCTGELVELSGTIHLVSQTQDDGSLIGHFNYQGVTAVGLTSGNIYHASAVDHFRLSDPFPSSISSIRSFHLISEGADSNLLVSALFHITVNGNGEVTTSIDTLDMQCT